MKTILLHVNRDSGQEARLQFAIGLARMFGGRIRCAQATPFDYFIGVDPYGGTYADPNTIAQRQASEAAERREIEGRLHAAGVDQCWSSEDGDPALILLGQSRLADAIVVSMPGERGGRDHPPLSIAADVAIHARAPVFVVPARPRPLPEQFQLMIAWNGTAEAAHALRAALEIIRRAASVTLVEVGEPEVEFPADAASEYLLTRGTSAGTIHHEIDGPIGSQLLSIARELSADAIVMGAYGHWRFRELVLGGATRHMLAHSDVPLVLAH